jgi:hypothetical protein
VDRALSQKAHSKIPPIFPLLTLVGSTKVIVRKYSGNACVNGRWQLMIFSNSLGNSIIGCFVVVVVVPVVLYVVCCHGWVGDPVIDDGVHADCDRIARKNLQNHRPNKFGRFHYFKAYFSDLLLCCNCKILHFYSK